MTTALEKPAPQPPRFRRQERGIARLGTYNLLDGGEDRWTAQIQFLKAQELDILCVQEAKRWDADGSARMFATAEALGMQALLARSASHDCHLVTFYRYPRVRCLEFRPDVAEGKFHHTVSRADFTVNGVRLRVLNTHLAPFRPTVRSTEAGWLTEYAAPGLLTALMGDLNGPGLVDDEPEDWDAVPAHLHSRHRRALPDGSYGGSDRDAVAALIHAGFADPAAQLGIPAPRTAGYWHTKPEERWDHRSDHILLNPDLAPRLRSYKVVDTPAARRLSDHLLAMVTLELPEAA